MRSARRWKPACGRCSLKNGAEVVGGVKHPLGTSDFSSYVLQAQAANPDVIALNSGGDDTIGALKAIREFGIKAKVMGFGLDSPTGIRAMGLQISRRGPTTLPPGCGAMTTRDEGLDRQIHGAP